MPTTKKGKAVTLNDRLHCEARVEARTKFYDKQVKGLLADVSPRKNGQPPRCSFALKYTNPVTKKRETMQLGKYVAGVWGVDQARIKASNLRNDLLLGKDIAQHHRKQKKKLAQHAAKTVDEMITEYVADISTEELKPWGVVAPREESCMYTAAFLRRFVSPRLGTMIASEVTNADIALLQEDLKNGVRGSKPSLTNARRTRIACSKLFKWAAEAHRGYVAETPVHNLPKVRRPGPKQRVLSRQEINALWHGLDRPDCPCDRRVALALKFMLVTMLRQKELREAKLSELETMGELLSPRALQAHNLSGYGEVQMLRVPAERVKKRRVIMQPLTQLALSMIKEAKREGCDFIFSHDGQIPLRAEYMAVALKGQKVRGKVHQLGICEWLGLKPFTPHDLRRSAATHAQIGAGMQEYKIAYCLDHQSNAPAVTSEVYVLSQHIPEKLEVLKAWEVEMLEMVGADQQPQPVLKLVA